MRQCKICNKLIFDMDWIDHFRLGDEEHRLAYYEVIRDID